ncbi:MAG TPA: four-carbon acid sugar kinase family protein, partial [Candidatus Limnocylindria bacterium]
MTPAPWPDDLLPDLARGAARRPAVVLDDDPTGTQTLRDVPVLTAWDPDAIARHLHEPVVFLSTNSRSLDTTAAEAVTRDAVVAAIGAARASDRDISVISRSDSTLRGHFPTETVAVAEAMDMPGARVLLAPYFGEGGRVTVDDVHHLERDGHRVPVADTEFAQDAVFGYRSSNLREWVAERYAAAGRGRPPMTSLSLELVRTGGPQAVVEALRALPAGGVALANAELDRDIEVVALGALLAEEAGLPLVARTAASYVRGRAGRPPAPLLDADELPAGSAGLVVVGSHVATTTEQLARLRDALGADEAVVQELSVADLFAAGTVGRTAPALDAAMRSGRLAILATERARRDVGFEGGRAISSALVAIVERLEERPA